MTSVVYTLKFWRLTSEVPIALAVGVCDANSTGVVPEMYVVVGEEIVAMLEADAVELLVDEE